MEKNLYFYSGPVVYFEVCICNKWEGYTHATSEKQARSFLTRQFKREHGYEARFSIKLPGKIKLIGKENDNGEL